MREKDRLKVRDEEEKKTKKRDKTYILYYVTSHNCTTHQRIDPHGAAMKILNL